MDFTRESLEECSRLGAWNVILIILRNEFDFWNVHGITNTLYFGSLASR